MRCFLILLAGPLLAANFCAGPAFAEVPPVNFLEGKPLRYLIGADGVGQGREDEVTVSPYDAGPATHGISIGYCNLFDENNTGRYGPYLHKSDTAAQYNEGQIDPRGRGWDKNLREQFERRKKQGFAYIELILPSSSTSDKKIQPDHQEIDGVPRSYRNASVVPPTALAATAGEVEWPWQASAGLICGIACRLDRKSWN
jgi:hypothetical protein